MAEINIEGFEARLRGMATEIEAAIKAGHDESGPVELDQTRQGRLSRVDALQRQDSYYCFTIFFIKANFLDRAPWCSTAAPCAARPKAGRL